MQQCKCTICQKEFVEKAGMAPMESNLAIRYRNKVGNICKDCQEELRSTKKGRRQLFWWNFKVVLYCARFLSLFVIVFAALIVCLGMFVL